MSEQIWPPSFRGWLRHSVVTRALVNEALEVQIQVMALLSLDQEEFDTLTTLSYSHYSFGHCLFHLASVVIAEPTGSTTRLDEAIRRQLGQWGNVNGLWMNTAHHVALFQKANQGGSFTIAPLSPLLMQYYSRIHERTLLQAKQTDMADQGLWTAVSLAMGGMLNKANVTLQANGALLGLCQSNSQ